MSGASPAAHWRVDLEDYVGVLEVSPSRGQAVAGSLGGDVVLVDTAEGSTTALERHEMGALSAAWSSDGDRVAVGGQDGRVRIYDQAGTPSGIADVSAWATALAWSPDAPVLAIGAGRRLLIVDHNGAVLHDFDDQPSTVTAVAWSADGTMPASSSGHDKHIEDLAWTPSGASIATGGGDGRTIVWGAPTRAGQALSPTAEVESDISTSRLQWVSEDCLLIGRADGSIVKLAV